MKLDFQGKRALVTGGGKGIGRQIAKALAANNAHVIALGRDQADLDSLSQEIGCETISADLTDTASARNAAERAGDVDLLVNNAGLSILQPFLEATPEAFEQTMALNVRAVMVVSQVLAAGMIRRGNGGSIVNVSSIASSIALRDHATYCASKGALDQLTRVMALELGPHKIRVNAVNPTVVMTPMGRRAWEDPAKGGAMLARISLGRFVELEDCADTICYLLSDAAAMIHGVTLPIDGGFTST